MKRPNLPYGMTCTLALAGSLLSLQAQAQVPAATPPAASAPKPSAASKPQSVAEFVPHPGLTLSELEQLLLERDSELQDELGSVEQARAEQRGSHLLPNLGLDAAVGTIPIGPPNPPELATPLTSIPNYSVGLSLRPDLLRRSAQQKRAAFLVKAASANLRASMHERALELVKVLGELATAQLRVYASHDLREQAQGLLTLVRSRVDTGYAAGLEADRAEIDLYRVQEQLLAREGEIQASLASCAQLLGMRCQRFSSEATVRAFLNRWLNAAQVPAGPALQSRPDLVAMAAQQSAAEAEVRLAHAQALPDPTFRFGYTYDSFVISGNQQHSLNVAMSLPLPLFNHGQAEAEAASSRASRLQAQRQRKLWSTEAQLTALREALAVQAQRREVLVQKMLPRARAMLADLTRAFELRTLRLTELLQARTTVDELLLAEADNLRDSLAAALAIALLLPVAETDASADRQDGQP